MRIIIHVPYDTLDPPHTAVFAVSLSALGDPGPMAANVGKTTAFHSREAIEAFGPQDANKAAILVGMHTPTASRLNHFALEMALHGPWCAPCENGSEYGCACADEVIPCSILLAAWVLCTREPCQE